MITPVFSENAAAYAKAGHSKSSVVPSQNMDVEISKAKEHLQISGQAAEGQDRTDVSRYTNFVQLCREFPDVRFIAADADGNILPGYDQSGCCADFGELWQVSVLVDEQIIENWHTDHDNIVKRLQELVSHYDNVVQDTRSQTGPRGEVYNYAFVRMHYTQSGWIDFEQTSCSDAPLYYQKPGLHMQTIENGMLEAYLSKVQKEMTDRLFALVDADGEDAGKAGKALSVRDRMDKYEKTFMYMSENIGEVIS